MTPPRGTVFLERDTYRRRRVMDGARILPVAGFVLILLPVLWSYEDGSNIATEAVYLFILWCVLIILAAILARFLRPGLKRDVAPPEPPLRAAGAEEPAQKQAQKPAPETEGFNLPEPLR